MTIPKITVVAGSAGAGKTTWITQQIACSDVTTSHVLYFSPGVGNVPIDQTRLKSEYPTVKVFKDGEEVEFLRHLPSADAVYIELGFYLELNAVAPILDNLSYRAIAILPPHLQDSEYHAWADKIILGATTNSSMTTTQLWRVPTTGEVIDEDSLEDFWYEITHAAYGQVSRAKGIFDVGDGRSLYADFAAGVPSTDFLELDLPRHLENRPQRFSGIEVSGENLDETAIGQTLEDCCLSDAAIWQYQQQVKQVLLEEIEA
ncbi:GTP-binding protein [Brasilonema octagenarum UFV-E1]|uniref:GTP-binding protein n=1 Tax=Brasilonema sennae CENA114 TaxID=415709 RepID=A0A856M9C2_9CYAN|nr:GTP-binding protein [Brasilonema sennae]QDL07358.1 GTP-binding protein [Brasilonema sennae CENA114]QDL13720.1 GTP-binding protein [Brasilonema octagenarum UFV-E1]